MESLNAPPKLCPKIILEGTRLTNKTELAFALNEHPRIVGPRKYRYHSPLVSAEWCSFTNFPWGRGLINFDAHEESQAMETYATWAKLFELQRYYSWIVDRFHISTTVVQAAKGRHYDFSWLENRLASLGFCIVLCTRPESSFESARAARLKVSGNPRQYDNLQAFIREQDEFKKAVDRSVLPHFELDITQGTQVDMVERIADWLEMQRLLGYY